MKVENNILIVPVDFGYYSSNSIKYALKLSEEINSEIHLVHVIANEPWLKGIFKSTTINELIEEKLKAVIIEYNLPSNTKIKVLEGVRHKQILEYADYTNPRYIILTDNYPAIKGIKKIGSTLSQVIISSKFPVITAKSTPESFFKKVLLPLDLNQDCSLKLNKSVKLAKKYNSEIKISSVVFGNINNNLRINEKLDQYKQVYKMKGIKHSIQLIKKKNLMAFKEILKTAEKYKCDSILLMTHKETGIDNYLGAFAHHIINEANIPVITITKQAAKRDKYSLLTPFVDPFGIVQKQMA